MLMTVNWGKISSKFLLMLILADFIFIAIHMLYTNQVVIKPVYAIDNELSGGEIYQYVKEFWAALLLLLLGIRNLRPFYFAWSAVFLYLLAEDSLQIHETAGKIIAGTYGDNTWLQSYILPAGELIVPAVVGGLLLLVIGGTYLKSSPDEKKISRELFVLVSLIAFFGVAVDFYHSIVASRGFKWWGLIEDGGEMLAMSIALWYIFRLPTGGRVRTRMRNAGQRTQRMGHTPKRDREADVAGIV